MGEAIKYKCNECGEVIYYTVDGCVMLGPHKVFHYQCPECKTFQEEWIKNFDGKAKRPRGVLCDCCGKKTKAISLKTLVCPNCGCNKMKESGMLMLD